MLLQASRCSGQRRHVPVRSTSALPFQLVQLTQTSSQERLVFRLQMRPPLAPGLPRSSQRGQHHSTGLPVAGSAFCEPAFWAEDFHPRRDSLADDLDVSSEALQTSARSRQSRPKGQLPAEMPQRLMCPASVRAVRLRYSRARCQE